MEIDHNLIDPQENVTCDKKLFVTASKTSYSFLCISYFSQMFNNFNSQQNTITVNFDINFKYLENFLISNFNVIVHKTKTSHLFSDFIKVKKGFQYGIEFKTYAEILLPFPYQTNCFNYEEIYGIERSDKSQEDCIVKYMQQKELEVCGCNRKWFYSQVESFNTIFCGNNSCNVLFDKKKLEKICRKNCENQYYIQKMNSKIKNNKIWSNIAIYKGSEDIVVINKPKMVLIEVLCSLGGIVSMWLGISLFDFISKCLKKILKLIGKLESSKITINVKEKFLRLVVIFKYALILTFFGLMLYQIIEVINIYSEQQTITRFDILHIKTLPEIGFLARIPSKKLIKKLDSIYGIKSIEEEFYEIFYRLLNKKSFIKFDEYF
jgi:hypothetical protein